MPLIIHPAPAAAMATLDATMPRLAGAAAAAPAATTEGVAGEEGPSLRVSVARRAPNIAAAARSYVDRGARAVDGVVSAPVVIAGLDTLAAGRSPRSLEPRLWANVLHDSAHLAVAIADVDAHDFKFTAVSEGDSVSALGRTLRQLRAGEADSPVQRELAMIRVPALHLTAVWLKGTTSPDDDVVIPNPGPIAPLVAGKRYTMAEFMAVVTPMAADRLRQVQPTSGG